MDLYMYVFKVGDQIHLPENLGCNLAFVIKKYTLNLPIVLTTCGHSILFQVLNIFFPCKVFERTNQMILLFYSVLWQIFYYTVIIMT